MVLQMLIRADTELVPASGINSFGSSSSKQVKVGKLEKNKVKIAKLNKEPSLIFFFGKKTILKDKSQIRNKAYEIFSTAFLMQLGQKKITVNLDNICVVG